MYIADRTSLFLKIQKQFDFWQFTIAMVLALGVGLMTLKPVEEDLGFLSRDQTDEVSEKFASSGDLRPFANFLNIHYEQWKGWMQIVILIYHYYHASSVSGVYNPIRVLVAAVSQRSPLLLTCFTC